MHARIAAISARQPDRVLAAVAVLAAACGVAVGLWEERLNLGGSGRTAPLVIRVEAARPLAAASNQVALDVMRARLRATSGVVAVHTRPAAEGGRSTALVVSFSDDPGRGEAAVATIQAQLDPGPLRIEFSGGATELRDAREEALGDLRLLLLAAPLAALMMIGALGARAALAVLFAVAAAILSAAAICIALSLAFDLSVLCLLGAAAATPVAVLQCGLAQRGASWLGQVTAALAAATVFASLAVLGVGYLAAIALGGALASLLAAPFALAAMTAARSLWETKTGEGTWAEALLGLVRTAAWSRAVAITLAMLATAALLVMALPVTGLDPTAFAAPAAPEIPAGRLAAGAGGAAASVLLIGWLAGRRLVGSVAAVLTVPLAALAGAGLCVLVFEEEILDGLLGIDPTPIGVGSLAAGTVAVAASSAAGAVAALAARREGGLIVEQRYAGWAAATEAGALGSAVGAFAGAALLFSSLGFVQVLGLLALAGFLLDLLLVRGLLTAALLALGRRG